MSLHPTPSINERGVFTLDTPLDSVLSPNTEYICKAIRKISEYIANNENVEEIAYLRNGLTTTDYENDRDNDLEIVSLQSTKSHWVYIPSKYFLTYANKNGVEYRSSSITVSLPAMPASLDLSFVEQHFKDYVAAQLGVTANSKQVVTSKIIQVDEIRHLATQAARNQRKDNASTDHQRYQTLLTQHTELLNRYHELETLAVYLQQHQA